ncbi:hypothetical protein [Pontixanthobacter sp.]|uniref:hypothetical protein n=1 Tax=Pontixanthobacter sp. TaxID=2792078 RepID=UPI003C7DE679
MNQLYRGVILPSAALLLSGCVAAVIPLAAGGAILGKDRLDAASGRAANAGADTAQPAAAQQKPAEQTEPVLKRENAKVTPPGPAYVDLLDVAPRSPRPPKGLDAPTEPGAPLSTAPPARTPQARFSARAYDAMYRYVETEANRDPVERPRQSAVLAAPGALSPSRADCSIRPPAVLFDLDPADGLFDAATMRQAQPQLADITRALRSQEVDIFWLSGQTALKAAPVRRLLAASGLDPEGDDGLLLMRRAEDRKQQRRADVQDTHCLIAIAGDTRADFDELYDYLKSPELAQPLEELVGAGWFLAPLPLSSGSAAPTTPTFSSEGQ